MMRAPKASVALPVSIKPTVTETPLAADKAAMSETPVFNLCGRRKRMPPGCRRACLSAKLQSKSCRHVWQHGVITSAKVSSSAVEYTWPSA